KKYRPRIAALEERRRRAEQAVAREQEQATRSGIEAGISVVGSILGAVLGRKGISAADVGPATTAARRAGRGPKERPDVGPAPETKEAVEQDQAALEAELQAELAELEAKADALAARLETVTVKPKKTHVAVRLVALVWCPHDPGARG